MKTLIFRTLSALALFAMILGAASIAFFQPILNLGNIPFISAADSSVMVVFDDNTTMEVNYPEIEGYRMQSTSNCNKFVAAKFMSLDGTHVITATDGNGGKNKVLSFNGIKNWDGENVKGLIVCLPGDNVLITK